jgi:hypothetical protein
MLLSITLSGIALSQDLTRSSALLEQPRAVGSGKHSSKLSRIGKFLLTTAVTADCVSSWGKQELNPLLRSSNGNFGMRGAAVKFGFLGATYFILKRGRLDSAKPVVYGEIAASVWLTSVALRNSRISR